jgi:hypothetical protein
MSRVVRAVAGGIRDAFRWREHVMICRARTAELGVLALAIAAAAGVMGAGCSRRLPLLIGAKENRRLRPCGHAGGSWFLPVLPF